MYEALLTVLVYEYWQVVGVLDTPSASGEYTEVSQVEPLELLVYEALSSLCMRP